MTLKALMGLERVKETLWIITRMVVMVIHIDQNSSSNIPKIGNHFVCKLHVNKTDSF